MWPGRRLEQRAARYRQLATALEAGLPVEQALSLVLGGAVARPGEGAAEGILAGGDLSGELAASAALPALEERAIETGETTGRLPAVLERLAEDLELRAARRRRLAARLAYPFLLVHAAALLPNLRWLVIDGVAAYLARALPALAIFYAAVAGLALILRGAGRELRRSAGFARGIGRLPWIGPLVRDAAAASYAELLGLQISAGLPMDEALARSAGGATSAAVADSARRIHRRVVTRGSELAAAFAGESRHWPSALVAAVRIGEASGRLEETLERAARGLRREVERSTAALVAVVAATAYLAAAAYVAYAVVSAYVAIYAGI